MEELFFDSENYHTIDFNKNPMKKGVYDSCNFTGCNFANTDPSGIKFLEYSFSSCNLSLAKLSKTVFRGVEFKDCKMLGLLFDTCDDFGLSSYFQNCTLTNSTFYKTTIKNTIFKNLKLIETDFTECDLSDSVFDHCDLTGATFENTNLENVDFRYAFNYSIDPEISRIKKVKFSLHGKPGLLNKYEIEID
jgi:fluoroquinolone resistance protein